MRLLLTDQERGFLGTCFDGAPCAACGGAPGTRMATPDLRRYSRILDRIAFDDLALDKIQIGGQRTAPRAPFSLDDADVAWLEKRIEAGQWEVRFRRIVDGLVRAIAAARGSQIEGAEVVPLRTEQADPAS